LYTDIIVTYLVYRESQYESIIFKMGMKKIPYWLVTYILYAILIFLPFMLTVAAGYTSEMTDIGYIP
jgi:hypothetical protein